MTHLLPILTSLRRQGCDARLLCLGGGGLAEAAGERGLPTGVLAMTGPWDPRVLRPLRRRLLATPWDIVHTHGMRANLPVRMLWPGILKAVASSRGGVPTADRRPVSARDVEAALSRAAGREPCLFTTVHSDLEIDYTDPVRRRLYPLVDRLTRARVDRTVCVSDDVRRRLETEGWDAERLVVVRSGLERRPCASPAGAQSLPVRSADEVGVDPGVTNAVWRGRPPAAGAPRVGTVARLVAVKDLDLFLEVVALLLPSAPHLRAAVVGGGPERERLTARARTLGLERVVTFSGDVRPGSEAVREFDIFMLTSASEALGMTVLEAMAAGLPVVATEVGGVREVVVDGITGALVPRSGDRAVVAAGLAERVLALLRDPALRAAQGAAGAARVWETFSADAAARATIAAYEGCLGNAGVETRKT
ncbi:MAG: glycosyltransferase [Thermoleophilia bacterium]